MSFYKNVSKEVLGLGAVVLAGFVFLVAAGYITVGGSSIFAFEPYISVSRSIKSPQGFFGSAYNPATLAMFDIKPYFTTAVPSVLNQVTFKVTFQPGANQADNGLRNISLAYYSCHPGAYAYGYYPTVCENYVSYPTSIIGDAGGSLVTFSPGWNFYSKASVQTIRLDSTLVFSGKSSTRKREIQVRFRNADDLVFVQAGSTSRQRVRIGTGSGNWLTINQGYGYPR